MHKSNTLVLTDDFIRLSPAIDTFYMLSAYSHAVLQQAGFAAPQILRGVGTKTEKEKDAPCFILRADAYFSSESLTAALKLIEKPNSDFKLVTGQGDTLAVYLNHTPNDLQIDDFAEFSGSISYAQKLAGCLITPQNAERIFALRNSKTLDKLRLSGVWIEKDDSVIVSPFYDIGKGTFLGKGTRLYGCGKIGENCVLTQGCCLTDTQIGHGVSLTGVVAETATVGDDTRIGPYAYLRPGSVIGSKVKIGDFVEIKNSSIGDKTSIAHLTYIGDCEVGTNVNFGCGTVISNYDGQNKYRTAIGNYAFIGCNTNLIAPVTVGDNAYIAAGSTITEDVPDTALAIARERQCTKPEWVKQKKPELIGKERC